MFMFEPYYFIERYLSNFGISILSTKKNPRPAITVNLGFLIIVKIII